MEDFDDEVFADVQLADEKSTADTSEDQQSHLAAVGGET